MTIFKYKLDKTRMFVVCYFCEHKRTHAGRIFASSFSTGPPGDRGALHCHWNAIATQPIGLVPFQARGILPIAEEHSRTRGGQNGGVEDKPQYSGLWRSRRTNARSFTRSPSSPPPSFTQYPFPPRSLVRDGQTVCVFITRRLVHTDLSSSCLVAHVLHYPPPPTRTALY